MLTKGHDYHAVTLAVVLGMDNMLGMADYRARAKSTSNTYTNRWTKRKKTRCKSDSTNF